MLMLKFNGRRSWYWTRRPPIGVGIGHPKRQAFHPKYAPVHRYARDIIGCLNNWEAGRLEHGSQYSRRSKLAENWCVAPVLVDTEKDEVYLHPIIQCHYVIRPKANIIGVQNTGIL